METFMFAGLGLLMAATAYGDLASVDGMAGFERLDTNADGLVSRQEANAFRALVFDRLDANRDGVITATEIVERQHIMQMRLEFRQSAMALAASQLDSDGDGTITKDEFGAAPGLFAIFDVNEDGQISDVEAADLLDRFKRLRN